jgi:hypothetical protein
MIFGRGQGANREVIIAPIAVALVNGKFEIIGTDS